MSPQCAHTNTVPVDSGGVAVAGLCSDCHRQLPASWFTCGHDQTIEVTALDQQHPEHLCLGCGTQFADTTTPVWQ